MSDLGPRCLACNASLTAGECRNCTLFEEDGLLLRRQDFADHADVTFPLRDGGRVWYAGWDCPGYWALDAEGRWFSEFGAHGGTLKVTTGVRVLSELESTDSDVAAVRVRKLLGRKLAFPGWMRAALGAGWTPPDSFKRDDYE